MSSSIRLQTVLMILCIICVLLMRRLMLKMALFLHYCIHQSTHMYQISVMRLHKGTSSKINRDA